MSRFYKHIQGGLKAFLLGIKLMFCIDDNRAFILETNGITIDEIKKRGEDG
jgi:hypothetical protein